LARRRGKGQQATGRGSARLRVAEEIRVKVSELLLRELSDPRLVGVHLTRVEMEGHLGVAHLYWRPMPGGPDTEEATAGLRAAAGFLRRAVGRSLNLRKVPELDFQLDPLPDEAARVDALLAEVLPPPADDDAD
jgi:ribosome-binding factor A